MTRRMLPAMIGAILLQETEALTAGTGVQCTGRTLEVPVGDALLGRVIDPLGNPLDGEPAPRRTRWQRLESGSPPIVARDFVHAPLYTGIKIVDTLIPIGKGQRQLLIGDEGLGRSSIALDTVVNLRGKDVYCVYVLIGQRRSNVVNTIETLREYQALPLKKTVKIYNSFRKFTFIIKSDCSVFLQHRKFFLDDLCFLEFKSIGMLHHHLLQLLDDGADIAFDDLTYLVFRKLDHVKWIVSFGK